MSGRLSQLDPQLVLRAYAMGVFPMADHRDAAIAAGAEFTDALEEKMVELAHTKDTLKASLEKLVRSSSDELKTGLRNIIERTKSGQDLNLWTFVIAIAASSVIMQLAINRLITRPISKTVAFKSRWARSLIGPASILQPPTERLLPPVACFKRQRALSETAVRQGELVLHTTKLDLFNGYCPLMSRGSRV